MSGEQTGRVKFFKSTWGFITPDVSDSGCDVFCHWSNIAAGEGEYRTLQADDRVRFTEQAGERGAYAVNVRRLE